MEEVREEHEVAEVHDERELDVEVGDLALSAVALDVVGPQVYQAADDHLRQLTASDGHRDPPAGQTGDETVRSGDKTVRSGDETVRPGEKLSGLASSHAPSPSG